MRRDESRARRAHRKRPCGSRESVAGTGSGTYGSPGTGVRFHEMKGLARRSFRSSFVAAALVVAVCNGASADVVLHEYISVDPAEDLRLGATGPGGAMPAAIQTLTGPVGSPDLERGADHRGAVYGSADAQAAPAFHIDRDTTRPNTVSYSDPFTPAVAPYKREFAYDSVDEHFDLVIRDPSLVSFPVGGSARPEDDQFYADIEAELADGQAARIPTVGPGARLLGARADPAVDLRFFRDSAENWFVRGDRGGRFRIILHIAIDRAAFGSAFADVDFDRLSRFTPRIPERLATVGTSVARQIGVVEGTSPGEALRILVKHFRSFSPSEDRPKSTGLDLYRELAVSQKGVCRHRAYAFVLTALALGLPARFVRNEAHAWVEVFDAFRWHRIDLGGAASDIQYSDDRRVAHVPPRDPFEWPPGADSGQAMAERARSSRGTGTGTGRTDVTGGAPRASPEVSADPEDRRPKSMIILQIHGSETRRGARIKIGGRIEADGAPCAEARVDLYLESPGRERIAVGALVTGDDGRYEGHVAIPYSVPPGDYDVRASTPGTIACGQGVSEP